MGTDASASSTTKSIQLPRTNASTAIAMRCPNALSRQIRLSTSRPAHSCTAAHRLRTRPQPDHHAAPPPRDGQAGNRTPARPTRPALDNPQRQLRPSDHLRTHPPPVRGIAAGRTLTLPGPRKRDRNDFVGWCPPFPTERYPFPVCNWTSGWREPAGNWRDSTLQPLSPSRPAGCSATAHTSASCLRTPAMFR